MSRHHLFDAESPFQDQSAHLWPYAQHHSLACNCEAMVQYSAEQRRRREWDEAVAAERQRQIDKGFDRAHDEQHGIRHVLTWAAEYARRGEHVKADALRRAAVELVPEPGESAVGEAEALAAIARSLYNRHITSFDTFDEIDGILRSVGHGPTGQNHTDGSRDA